MAFRFWKTQFRLAKWMFGSRVAGGIYVGIPLVLSTITVTHTWSRGRDGKLVNKLPHDKANKMTCSPSEDSISPRIRPVWSVFTIRMKEPWVLSYPLSAQRIQIRLRRCPGWSESAGRTGYFVGFVMGWLKSSDNVAFCLNIFQFKGICFYRNSCKQCRPWSDATFCGIWSRSSLFWKFIQSYKISIHLAQIKFYWTHSQLTPCRFISR